MPFWIGHPPPTHQMQSICVQEGSGVPNLQMELNYLDSFKSYGIFSDFVVPIIPLSSLSSPGGLHTPMAVVSVWFPPHVVPTSPWSPHHPRHPHIIPIIPMSSPHHLEGPYIIPNAPDSH